MGLHPIWNITTIVQVILTVQEKRNKKYAYMWAIVVMIKKKEHVFINCQENKQFSTLGFGRNQTLFDNFISSFLFFSYLEARNGKQR